MYFYYRSTVALTLTKLSSFDNDFPQYMCFGSSVMSSCVESGVLQGRLSGGVMTLVSRKLSLLLFVHQIVFTARRYASAVLAVVVCLSVCLCVCVSVCPSQAGIVSKRL